MRVFIATFLIVLGFAIGIATKPVAESPAIAPLAINEHADLPPVVLKERAELKEESKLSIDMKGLVEFRGRVVDSNGKGLAGASIWLEQLSFAAQNVGDSGVALAPIAVDEPTVKRKLQAPQALSDHVGDFRLLAMGEHQYRICIEKKGYSFQIPQPSTLTNSDFLVLRGKYSERVELIVEGMDDHLPSHLRIRAESDQGDLQFLSWDSKDPFISLDQGIYRIEAYDKTDWVSNVIWVYINPHSRSQSSYRIKMKKSLSLKITTIFPKEWMIGYADDQEIPIYYYFLKTSVGSALSVKELATLGQCENGYVEVNPESISLNKLVEGDYLVGVALVEGLILSVQQVSLTDSSKDVQFDLQEVAKKAGISLSIEAPSRERSIYFKYSFEILGGDPYRFKSRSYVETSDNSVFLIPRFDFTPFIEGSGDGQLFIVADSRDYSGDDIVLYIPVVSRDIQCSLDFENQVEFYLDTGTNDSYGYDFYLQSTVGKELSYGPYDDYDEDIGFKVPRGIYALRAFRGNELVKSKVVKIDASTKIVEFQLPNLYVLKLRLPGGQPEEINLYMGGKKLARNRYPRVGKGYDAGFLPEGEILVQFGQSIMTVDLVEAMEVDFVGDPINALKVAHSANASIPSKLQLGDLIVSINEEVPVGLSSLNDAIEDDGLIQLEVLRGEEILQLLLRASKLEKELHETDDLRIVPAHHADH